MVRQVHDAQRKKRGYHHGNLRETLVEAGFKLARTGGPNAVLIRAAAREAGVSHNAAYRHFANQEDLLAVVGERCMTRLGRLMLKRTGEVEISDPVQRAEARLEAIGRAYIEFARTEPGWFQTAFSAARPHLLDAQSRTSKPDGTGDAEESVQPFAVLNAQLDELVTVGAVAPKRRQGAEFGCWSAVHGLSSLLLTGPLRDLEEPQVEHAISSVLATVHNGLR